MNTKGLIVKARNAYYRDGLSYLIKTASTLALSLVANCIILAYYRSFRSNEMFEFNGRKYHYFYSLYGSTWRTERSVEIPIIWEYVKSSRNAQERILEVGNVLSYRFKVSHDILDKYEKIDAVINQDIVDYNPNYKYDLIVTISTLEHVGYDEDIREPRKIITALDNLKRLLNDGGKLVVTLPLGQNTEMDKLITNKEITFDKIFYMVREKKNMWKQVKEVDPISITYNERIESANAIIIGIIGV